MKIRDEDGNVTAEFKEAIVDAIRSRDEAIMDAINEVVFEYIQANLRVEDNSDYYGSGKSLKIYPPSSSNYNSYGVEIFSTYNTD